MKDEKSNDQSDEKPVGLLGDSLGFKLSIAIPIGLGGLILLVILGMNWETMEFCSTGACINYWAVYFRVPLLIMSLAVPITAMYIAHHRSQHQDQIYKQQVKVYNEQGFENRRSNYLAVYKDFETGYKELVSKYDKPHMAAKINGIVSAKALFTGIVTVNNNFVLELTENYLYHFWAAQDLEIKMHEQSEGAIDDVDLAAQKQALRVYINKARRAGFISKEITGKQHTLTSVLDHLTIINEFLHDFIPFMLGFEFASFGKSGLQNFANALGLKDVNSSDFLRADLVRSSAK